MPEFSTTLIVLASALAVAVSMVGKGPKPGRHGRASFYCMTEKKKYRDIEILERKQRSRGGDLLIGKCPQGHKVAKFAKRTA